MDDHSGYCMENGQKPMQGWKRSPPGSHCGIGGASKLRPLISISPLLNLMRNSNYFTFLPTVAGLGRGGGKWSMLANGNIRGGPTSAKCKFRMYSSFI
ncbi:hypothetical protein U0070_027009 [Myodes glareolus]|uniref:Uncharacterized protein n=1 Tax=Myodes glareolus TaxID=447135 RepID=A0AAW0IJS1_MYOGA